MWVEPLDRLAQVGVGRLHNQVRVIVQLHMRMQDNAEAIHHLPEQFPKMPMFSSIAENHPTIDPARGYMIPAIRHIYSQWSGHAYDNLNKPPSPVKR